MTSSPIVTLDGPGGSGKGTISALLAKELGWHILDSGAIYRVLALAALKHDVPLNDTKALEGLALGLDVRFEVSNTGENEVYLEGEKVDGQLRTETCGSAASEVASMPSVRAALLQRQRDFLQSPGLVADGRDMGTVVFPDAPVKVFLTASLEERVRRRYKQLKEKGLEASIDALSREIAARDERDMNRATAPLKPADDAVQLDCSDMTIQEVLQYILKLVSEKYGKTGA